MNVCIESKGTLILRDGRPFGAVGNFGGNSLRWPQPQTLAGMVRTKIGLRRSPHYFSKKENIEEILKIKISHILASLKEADGKVEHLSPVPADLILMEEGEQKSYQKLSYSEGLGKGGTDIANPDWIIPRMSSKAKPAKERPFWLRWSALEKYIAGETPEAQGTGVEPPVLHEQFHNAIDRKTFATEESRLFLNRGIYLRARAGKKAPKEQEPADELLIHLQIEGLSDEDAPLGEAYLGGDRKTVQIRPGRLDYPRCPNIFENQQFLKLLFLTPADFGSWCPGWLMPDLEGQGIDWVEIPKTSYKVRLRTAVVPGWEGISGWDYAKRRPKAMRKLLRPGSVFLLEIKNPNESQKIAEFLWGNSLPSREGESSADGLGQVVVAKAEKV